MKKQFRVSRLAGALAVLLATAPVYAQNTTANLAGRVTAADGAPLAGADVTIVHTPSGTTSRATTDAEGRYVARGLRVGGPYTVTVQKTGFQGEASENVFLLLGETSAVNVDLDTSATELEGVEVVAAAQSTVFSPDSMGAGTSISRETLDKLPSLQRNLQDYARLDPRISQTDKERGEISAGGQNSRFNSVTIDGVTTSDTFGLEANNLPTAKQPISIDAIDSVQINVSNYDVTQKGYTGANINAVTKSGTNEFHGSVYYVYRDEQFAGDRYNRSTDSYFDAPDFEEDTAGFTFGGPLLKDTLFFFISYEELVSSRTGLNFGPLGSNLTNVAITPAAIAGATGIANSTYQFDPGVVDTAGAELKVEDALIKLDANIGENHRASLRWSKTEQSDPIFPTNFDNAISLSSHWYSQDKTIESYVGQIFSDWTDTFSTEFKVSYRDYISTPINNADLPQIRLNFTGALPAGSPTNIPVNAGLVFGTERSRHFNDLGTETWNYYWAGNWFVDAHDIKFGLDYDDNEVYNAFLQDTRGNYTFACINSSATFTYTDPLLAGGVVCNSLNRALSEAAVLENFRRGRPTSYQVQVGAPGFDLDDGVANWDYQNLGLFLQDTWSVNYNLTLTGGLRIDRKQMDTKPIFNPAAANAPIPGSISGTTVTRATGGFGLRNDETLDGDWLYQPRFGFNYTFDYERMTQLRGGLGLFEGAAANVWLSNPYSNTGLATRIIGCGIAGFAACPGADGLFSPNTANQPSNFTGAIPAANVDFLSSALDQPSVWKANLAFDKELPWYDMIATVEYIRTEVEDGVYYKHLNLGNPSGRSTTDGRDMFYTPQGYNTNCWQNNGATTTTGACAGFRNRALSNASFANVLVAERTGGGSGDNLSMSLSGKFWEDFTWGVGYSFTRATEVSNLSSSVSNSSWQSLAIFNANEEVAANSSYLVKDRFTGQLNWSRAFWGDYETSVGLFYEGRRGKPYSWIFNNDLNGDGATNDLLYIPRAVGSGEVVFRDFNGNGTADEESRFWDTVNQFGLNQYAGSVVPRNSFFAPWTNNFDLRFSQQLPGFFKGNKVHLILDVLNVGNLINKDWGRIDEIQFNAQGAYSRNFVNYLGLDPQGRYVYGVNADPEGLFTRQARGESQWAAQFTLKYEF
jgi:hypothetical protein